mmetsp:Transcript_42002/g.111380  ORF Transcript_42002/g.111380 Transcript_42002/m.111380 type:complete len:212 (+) Transcript_42002:1043-1678(+)
MGAVTLEMHMERSRPSCISTNKKSSGRFSRCCCSDTASRSSSWQRLTMAAAARPAKTSNIRWSNIDDSSSFAASGAAMLASGMCTCSLPPRPPPPLVAFAPPTWSTWSPLLAFASSGGAAAAASARRDGAPAVAQLAAATPPTDAALFTSELDVCAPGARARVTPPATASTSAAASCDRTLYAGCAISSAAPSISLDGSSPSRRPSLGGAW